MQYYFAAFLPTVEGGYFVRFPDVPEAFTQGEDFGDAMEMAADVLEIAVEEYLCARKDLPPPSSLEAVIAWAEEHCHDAGLLADKNYHVQGFAVPDMDMTPVRVSVSIAKSVLQAIDQKAKMANLTRSGLLVEAAKAYQPISRR